MVIFMPYYRQNGQLFHSHPRARPSATSSGQTNATANTTVRVNGCQIASIILCRFAFSLFLLIMALFLLRLTIDDAANQSEGSPIIATILLTIAIVSFIRTYQKLKQYYIILDTRRRLVQRLREQQQAYDLTSALNNSENSRNGNTDLPSYKELFPSHLDLTHHASEPLPSYDDYVQTLVIPHSTTSLPVPTLASESTSHPPRCIWITDRTRTPLCIRGTVTYV